MSDKITARTDIGSIRDSGLGKAERADEITVKGTVNYIKHDNEPYYTACITEGCNKKVEGSA